MHSSQEIETIITQERKRQNISLRELEKLTGIPKSTLSRYENGSRKFPTNKVEIFAKALHIDPLKLLGVDNVMSIDSLIKVPIIGTIACGTPILAEQNISGYQYIPSDFVSETKNLFFLRCQGDSMQPTIKNGSLVLVHKQPCVEDNEVAAVLINDQATLKRIKHLDNQILLMPDNKDYSPIILKQHDDNRVLGKAIQVINEL